MFSTHNRLLLLLGLLLCGSANATTYSCVDESGTKVLRNYPCDENEKQQVIEKEIEPSHTIINSTGERQGYRSREPEKYIYTVQRQNAAGNNSAANDACEKMLSEYNRLMNKEGGTMGDAMVAQGYRKKYIQCKSNSPLESGEHTQTFNKKMEKIEAQRQQQTLSNIGNSFMPESKSKMIISDRGYGSSISGSTEIEMRRKYDYDPANKYRGEIDRDGTVRMKNLNGDRLRGTIEKDGYGKLRDEDGNTYRVKPK